MRRWICLLLAATAVILSLKVEAVAVSAPTTTCDDREWDFTELALAQARERMKSRRTAAVKVRADCGIDVQSALDPKTIDPNCAGCMREYVGFLRDFIAFARLAAEKSAGAKTKRYYYDAEIEARLTLGDLLIKSGSDDPIRELWTDNFEGLGDALQRTGQGERFHKQATLAKPVWMREKSFDTWTRAIRSCDQWDFASGRNREMRHLEKELCVKRCKRAVERIRKRAAESGVANKSSYLESLDDLLPDTHQCPVESES